MEPIDDLKLQHQFGEAMEGVLRTIHDTIKHVDAEGEEDALRKIEVEALQAKPLQDQAVFVIRLLLEYLNDDGRVQALGGFGGYSPTAKKEHDEYVAKKSREHELFLDRIEVLEVQLKMAKAGK